MARARAYGIGVLVAWIGAFGSPPVWAQSSYCGITPGSCTGGTAPTLGGKVRLDGRGVACTWECQAADESVHACAIGDEANPCSMAGDAEAPPLTDRPVTGVTRDGEQVYDSFREHNPDILQTVEGEPFRVCRQRVQGQADIDAMAPFADRFGWGWATPATWATWEPLIEDACYQITPGFDFRPVFLRTADEFRSYLEWANERDDAQPPGSREVEETCLYLYESGTTQRDRYIAASPTGAQRNALGNWWIEETTPQGGCPCATEAWECDDMCPAMLAGDVLAGMSCGRPTCFSELSAHWAPDPATICDGVAYTQTNSCDGTTQNVTGTDTTPGCSNTPPPTCGGWDPSPGTVCDGVTFTQTCLSDATLTQQSVGTLTGCAPPPPACAGTWGPAPSTVCDGDSFTQTCSTDAALTRPATGTSTSACGGPCTNHTVTSDGGWSPWEGSVCAGQSFTQIRALICTPGTPGTGSCTTSCAGVPNTEEQPAVGTKGPDWQPDCNSVASGVAFEQSDAACGGGTQNAVGCGPPELACTERVLSDWSAWSPAPSEECKDSTFTQTSTRTCTPGTPGTGSCTHSCAGETLTRTRSAEGTSCTGSCGTLPACCSPCVERTLGTYGPWTPARSEICSGTPFERSRTRICTAGEEGCGGCDWSCDGVTTTLEGTSTGTMPRSPRTVSDWSAWSPTGPEVCAGESFTTYSTRTCTPGSGTCPQSCEGVSLSKDRPGTGSMRPDDWEPACNTVDLGETFTQTNSCDQTRSATGCNPVGCEPEWAPSPSTVCAGVTFTQTDGCGDSRQAQGQMDCGGWCCGSTVGPVGCTCWEVESSSACYGNLGYAGSDPIPGCELE